MNWPYTPSRCPCLRPQNISFFLFFIVVEVEVEVSTKKVACISYLHIIMYTKW